MEIDPRIIRESEYSVNWGLNYEAVTGEEASRIVLAHAASDSPKLYIDGTVR